MDPQKEFKELKFLNVLCLQFAKIKSTLGKNKHNQPELKQIMEQLDTIIQLNAKISELNRTKCKNSLLSISFYCFIFILFIFFTILVSILF